MARTQQRLKNGRRAAVAAAVRARGWLGVVLLAAFAASWMFGTPTAAVLHAVLAHGGEHRHAVIPAAGPRDDHGGEAAHAGGCGHAHHGSHGPADDADHRHERGHVASHQHAGETDRHGNEEGGEPDRRDGDGRPRPDSRLPQGPGEDDEDSGCGLCRELTLGKVMISTSIADDAVLAGLISEWRPREGGWVISVRSEFSGTARGPPAA